jgi:hypothetical protein
VYYIENFEIFHFVVYELVLDDAFSTTITREIFNGSNKMKVFKTDLAYIRVNLSFLPQLKKYTNILDRLKKINVSEAKALKQKFRWYLIKNTGF